MTLLRWLTLLLGSLTVNLSLALLDLFLFSWVFQIVVRSKWVGRVRNFTGGGGLFLPGEKTALCEC